MIRLEYRNVSMAFGSLTAIEGVTFSVADGEVVSLIGPSGCGKSTLLNIASGLAAPTGGEVLVVVLVLVLDLVVVAGAVADDGGATNTTATRFASMTMTRSTSRSRSGSTSA